MIRQVGAVWTLHQHVQAAPVIPHHGGTQAHQNGGGSEKIAHKGDI